MIMNAKYILSISMGGKAYASSHCSALILSSELYRKGWGIVLQPGMSLKEGPVRAYATLENSPAMYPYPTPSQIFSISAKGIVTIHAQISGADFAEIMDNARKLREIIYPVKKDFCIPGVISPSVSLQFRIQFAELC